MSPNQITVDSLLALGVKEGCGQLRLFRQTFPSGATPTSENMKKALTAGLEVGWLAAKDGLTRELVLEFLPSLPAEWRGDVVRHCEQLTREDVLAALPSLTPKWRGEVVCYCPRLTRKDVLALMPSLDAAWLEAEFTIPGG